MALNLATLSDAFNDIPYTEALMGSIDAGLEPSYDSQESIFQAVQILLDEGIADVNASSRYFLLVQMTFIFLEILLCGLNLLTV